MKASNVDRSPFKDHENTRLSIDKRSVTPPKNKKSKSQINIRRKNDLQNMNSQLLSLKQKIEVSKDILTTIYSKVKKKESIYENKISQKDLHINRAQKTASEYKNMYEDGLKMMEGCIDRNKAGLLAKKQQYFSQAKLQQLKKNALQKVKQKYVRQQPSVLKQSISQPQKEQKFEKSSIQNPKVSQFMKPEIAKKQTSHKKTDQTPIKKMMKSHSLYQAKTKSQIQKISISQFSKANKTKKQKDSSTKQVKNKQYPPQDTNQQKSNISGQPKLTQSKLIQPINTTNKQERITDQKKSLYEIYKQRILKRQNQQNSQKMSWIVQRLQQNINDLQMIRKKSQLKLSRFSPQSHNKSLSSKNNNKIENAESFEHKNKKQNKNKMSENMKRQRSKQKYLEIQKNKLKSINQSLM